MVKTYRLSDLRKVSALPEERKKMQERIAEISGNGHAFSNRATIALENSCLQSAAVEALLHLGCRSLTDGDLKLEAGARSSIAFVGKPQSWKGAQDDFLNPPQAYKISVSGIIEHIEDAESEPLVRGLVNIPSTCIIIEDETGQTNLSVSSNKWLRMDNIDTMHRHREAAYLIYAAALLGFQLDDVFSNMGYFMDSNGNRQYMLLDLGGFRAQPQPEKALRRKAENLMAQEFMIAAYNYAAGDQPVVQHTGSYLNAIWKLFREGKDNDDPEVTKQLSAWNQHMEWMNQLYRENNIAPGQHLRTDVTAEELKEVFNSIVANRDNLLPDRNEIERRAAEFDLVCPEYKAGVSIAQYSTPAKFYSAKKLLGRSPYQSLLDESAGNYYSAPML